MTLEQTVHQLLNITCDPFIQLTTPEMQIQSSILLEGERIHVQLQAGFPIEHLKHTCLPQLHNAFHRALPAYIFEITLLQTIKAHQTQLPGKGLRGVKNTIAIGSGKGGVGKSTVTVNLATALARMGARVGILDADIYGPSIPTLLGKTAPVQLNGDKYQPVFAHGVYAMSIGYLTHQDDAALIWRGPMLAKSLLQMLDITQWDDLDYLLIDLPPGTGDIQLSLVQKIPLAGSIVVTTPQQVATQDADKALNMFSKTNIPVLGLVENMAMHHCSQCGHAEALFGQGGGLRLSEKHQCDFLGQLPLNSRISLHSDAGTPTGENHTGELSELWSKLALNTSIALAKRPLNYAGKFPPVRVISDGD